MNFPIFTLFSRRFRMSSRTVLLLAAVGLLLGPSARAEELKETNLPLKRVVLFSSGVGFFEHSGLVHGDAKVELQFKVGQVNDLLKSMVVEDLDGGRIAAVNYGSKDPITKTLKSFAVDLTGNPTLAQLLQQVRGEKVEVEAPNKIIGVILGVEKHRKQVGDREFIDVEVLNLLTEEGLRAVPLETVGTLRLLNKDLDAELRKALALLASAHATDKKGVTLNFLGQGERRVRVGYIQETPVWKTTYRLVLSDEKAPLLQGWAIVENTSEEDWKDVKLSLVSGRPISFVMDLYQPLYVPRPEEQLELYASLRPQTYGQDLARKEMAFARLGEAPADRRLRMMVTPRGTAAGMGGGMGGMRGMAAAPATRSPASAAEKGFLEYADFATGQGVQSVAQAGDVGSLFQYVIHTPVTLPRQQSAMLPIVNADVKGKKVSIYNPRVQAKHPLSGLQLTNTTDLHLMQGPITVFDDGVYAGDAKIEDLPPGSQRLISYALDLDTEVAADSKGRPEELLNVRLLKGTMITGRKQIRETKYTVKNSGKSAKTVLVEYPLEAEWKLIEPKKPTEKTRDLYRFAVEAKPGVPATLRVELERTTAQHLAINNLNDQTIQFYLSAKVVSQKVKDALREVVRRKSEIQQVVEKKGQVTQKINGIVQDQNRIRQNMAQLDRNSEVYKNYVRKFSNQESEIEKLREESAALSRKEAELRKALDEYLMDLDLQ
ncbi:MAG: hypothetical protein JXB10_04020 [Pirellulales bacterium]|nr:hypothetical protein [Pirellulales bacterium]